jgi:hypothetical protein
MTNRTDIRHVGTASPIRRWSRRLAAWLAGGHVLLLGLAHLPLPAESGLPPGVCSVRGMASGAAPDGAGGADGNRQTGDGKPLSRLAAHGLSCPVCSGADGAPPPVLLASMDAAFMRSRLPPGQGHEHATTPTSSPAGGTWTAARFAHFESALARRLGVGAGPCAAHEQAPSHLIEKPLRRESRKQLSPFFVRQVATRQVLRSGHAVELHPESGKKKPARSGLGQALIRALRACRGFRSGSGSQSLFECQLGGDQFGRQVVGQLVEQLGV